MKSGGQGQPDRSKPQSVRVPWEEGAQRSWRDRVAWRESAGEAPQEASERLAQDCAGLWRGSCLLPIRWVATSPGQLGVVFGGKRGRITWCFSLSKQSSELSPQGVFSRKIPVGPLLEIAVVGSRPGHAIWRGDQVNRAVLGHMTCQGLGREVETDVAWAVPRVGD